MGIEIKPTRVAKVMARIGMRTFRACWTGAQRGAFMGKRHLVKLSPTDRGDLRRSWRVTTKRIRPRGGSGRPAILINDAPHAGIIEGGARPHPVSQEGIMSIAGWVARKRRRPKARKRTAPPSRKTSGSRPDASTRKQRKSKGPSKSDIQIAHAIAWKIRREGQKPTFFVRKELETLSRIANEQVAIKVRRIASKPPK